MDRLLSLKAIKYLFLLMAVFVCQSAVANPTTSGESSDFLRFIGFYVIGAQLLILLIVWMVKPKHRNV